MVDELVDEEECNTADTLYPSKTFVSFKGLYEGEVIPFMNRLHHQYHFDYVLK